MCSHCPERKPIRRQELTKEGKQNTNILSRYVSKGWNWLDKFQSKVHPVELELMTPSLTFFMYRSHRCSHLPITPASSELEKESETQPRTKYGVITFPQSFSPFSRDERSWFVHGRSHQGTSTWLLGRKTTTLERYVSGLLGKLLLWSLLLQIELESVPTRVLGLMAAVIHLHVWINWGLLYWVDVFLT